MAWVSKKKRTRWILAGKVVPANTEGAKREIRKSEFFYGFWYEAGKLKQQELTGCTDKKSAQARLAELLKVTHAVGDEEVAESGEKSRPLASYLVPYYEQLRAKADTPSKQNNAKAARARIDRYLRVVGHKKVTELRDNEGFEAAVLPLLGKPLTASSLRWVAATLNAFLRYVCRCEGRKKPGRGFIRVATLREIPRGHGTLTADEARQLLASLPEPQGVPTRNEIARWTRRLLYLLMLQTLTRMGSLVLVMTNQFELDGDSPALHLASRQTKTRRPISKSLTRSLADELRRYRECLGRTGAERFFRATAHAVRKSWNADLERAGLRTTDPAGRILGPHSLKGTGITLLIDQGLDIATVSELAEHTDTALTLRVYKDSLLRKKPLLRDHLSKLADTLNPSKEPEPPA